MERRHMFEGILTLTAIGVLTALTLGIRHRVIERQKRQRKAYLRHNVLRLPARGKS